MKRQTLPILFIFLTSCCYAQCPTIKGIFINACGVVASTEEGLNEFMVIKNGATPTLASDIVIKVPSANGGTPNSTTLSFDTKANATTLITNFDPTITNTSCKSTGATPILVPLGATDNIPPNADVIVFTGGKFETYPYNFNSYCGKTLYVLLNLKTVAPTSGAFANAAPRTSTISTTGCNAGAINSYTYITPANASVPSGSPASAGAGDGDYFSFSAPDNPTLASGISGVGSSVGFASNNGCGMPPPSVVLPVLYIKINAVASKTYNTINWQTVGEVNVSNFVVEKSTDGINFSAIGNFIATGNNSGYTFNDNFVATKTTFYRIVVVNIDGKKSYSDIVKLVNVKLENKVLVYPKIAQAKLNMEWESTIASNTNVIVIDALGRIILNKNFINNIGFNKNEIDIANFNAGQYFVRVTNGDTTTTEVFIKK